MCCITGLYCDIILAVSEINLNWNAIFNSLDVEEGDCVLILTYILRLLVEV
jgi:hypothetical protein